MEYGHGKCGHGKEGFGLGGEGYGVHSTLRLDDEKRRIMYRTVSGSRHTRYFMTLTQLLCWTFTHLDR